MSTGRKQRLESFSTNTKIPTTEELNLIREWFDSLVDVNPAYLESKDYVLARGIFNMLGKEFPHRYQDELDRLKKIGR